MSPHSQLSLTCSKLLSTSEVVPHKSDSPERGFVKPSPRNYRSHPLNQIGKEYAKRNGNGFVEGFYT